MPLDEVGTVVGVAGTVTTMAAMVLDLEATTATRINGARLARADVLRGGRADRGDDGGRAPGACRSCIRTVPT